MITETTTDPITAAVEFEFEAIDRDLRWRQTKSHRFIEMTDQEGQTHPIVWKRLDADLHLIQLEREARRAQARARAAWLTATNRQPQPIVNLEERTHEQAEDRLQLRGATRDGGTVRN